MKKLSFFLLGFLLPIISYSQNWQHFAGDSTLFPNRFYIDSSSNQLYAVSWIIENNGDTVVSPSRWNGDNFEQIGNFDFINAGFPSAIISYHDTIYIGGEFNKYRGAPGDYFLRLSSAGTWDTTDISPVNGMVHAFGILNDTLIAMGSFWEIGTMTSHSIAKFSNSHWFPVETGIFGGGYVRSMCSYNDSIIFTGSYSGDYLVPFDGNVLAYQNDSIFPFGRGIYIGSSTGNVNEGIMCSAVYQGQLYVAGDFSSDIGRTILKWDGTYWSTVGNAAGIAPFSIRTMKVYNNELYVGGSFVYIGGVYASHIAKWDGTKWCGLGSYINGSVNDITVYNNELIIAGGFNSIDGVPFNGIAKWVGGNYSDTCQVVGINELISNQNILISPTISNSVISVKDLSGSISEISLFDISGRLVKEYFPSTDQFEINIESLRSGMYFVKILSGESTVLRKVIKE